MFRGAALAAAAIAIAAHAAVAQIPIPALPRPTPARGDTLRQDTVKVPVFRVPPPVPPLAALARSMVLPGWGQAVLRRRGTGAFFVFWEGLTLTMTLKASHQLEYMRETGSEAAENKKQEVQDWAVLLVFNHLLSGAEAFVAAMLWDFPVEITPQRLPSGDLGLGLRLPIRIDAARVLAP
ncbi:MAG: hypothetical protein A2W29_05905 [Gemmatimonadetes bacterium RBG_16_66_8]|nr:MAG: hypothetical protein A2W29_05905 [Gemmatimonadetes bacterium RBG_16_66_8]